CMTQTDCQNPTFWCFPINGLTGSGAGMVPNGYCFGATPCPSGQNDCSGDPGTTCTPTSAGPQCLSNMYPLSQPDPGTDSGTDGGETDGGETDASAPDSGSGTGGAEPDGGADSGADAGDGG